MGRGEAVATLAFLRAGVIVAEVPVEIDRSCDLGLLHRLATLQLAARRAGWRVELRGLTPALEVALDRAGLASVLGERRRGGRS